MTKVYGIVYHAFNTRNGKAYVGQTTNNLKKRRRSHEKGGPSNYCRLFKAAIEKHGTDAFVWSTLAIIYSDKEDLDAAEDYWIKKFETLAPSGYNLKEGGSKGKASEETKRAMSRSQLIVQNRPDVLMKKSQAHLGKKRPDEWCENISLSLRGEETSKRSKEVWSRPGYREKQSNSMVGKNKGKKRTPEQIERWKQSRLAGKGFKYYPRKS